MFTLFLALRALGEEANCRAAIVAGENDDRVVAQGFLSAAREREREA